MKDDAAEDKTEVGNVHVQVMPNENDICTWTDDVDEKRRAFIINQLADVDVEGAIMVENMHKIYEWLKSGKLPDTAAKPTWAKK